MTLITTVITQKKTFVDTTKLNKNTRKLIILGIKARNNAKEKKHSKKSENDHSLMLLKNV